MNNAEDDFATCFGEKYVEEYFESSKKVKAEYIEDIKLISEDEYNNRNDRFMIEAIRLTHKLIRNYIEFYDNCLVSLEEK